MLRFRVIGSWLPAQVVCRWAPGRYAPPPEVSDLIDRAWAETLARPGVQVFDGPMCRLESITASTDRLELALSRTSYKPFVGTNLSHASGIADRFGAESLANPVGVSCALVSSEGRLMLGRRNDKVAYHPARIHPFAGCLEPREPMDVFMEALRELKEELGFAPADVSERRCLGMVEDMAIRQPELVILVRTGRSASEIERQLDAGEHHATCSIEPEPDSAARAVREMRLLTPVAVGTILLWGREAFGQGWFEQTSRFVVSCGA